MKQYRYETSIEPMVSRLAGLFAYIEFNDDWTSTLHPATDSYTGSWGKVVENLALPCGVGLCSYVSTDSVPSGYVWNGKDTVTDATSIPTMYSNDSPEYIRVVDNAVYNETENDETVSYTEMPVLPTADYNSPDYVKVPQKDGEGNVILDCNGNKVCRYYAKDIEYGYYKKSCMLIEGGTYSYRTLMDYYYRYRDVLGEDDPFISFMERGIGKMDVDKESLNMDDEERYPNVPDYVYLGNVRQMLVKYEKYHRLCEYYRSHFTVFGNTDERLESECEYYETIGGDRFMEYLKRLLKKANEIAAEYLCYAENRSKDLYIGLDVRIVQSKNDLGYLSCFINEFEPGGHYRHGEMVTYNGRTYICLLNRYVYKGENYPYVLCNGILYRLTGETYKKVDVYELKLPSLPSSLYNGWSCVLFGGKYYMWGTGGYYVLDVTEYCTGRWDDETEVNGFDTQHFVPISEYVNEVPVSLSIPEKTALDNMDGWYSDENIYGDKYLIYTTLPYLPVNYVTKNIKCGDTIFIWDDGLSMYIVDENHAESYIVSGSADSVLTSLRGYSQFVNGNESVDNPVVSEDWLYYYKIGNFNANGGIIWDKVGNIKRFGDSPLTVGQYATDMMAYGSILTDISCDTTNKEIVFTYVVNAHLKAPLMKVEVDLDGNELYFYGRFEYDGEDSHGVVYTERHRYTDPDIDDLVENGDFQAFVENRISDIPNFMTKYGYKKFVFENNVLPTTVQIGDQEYSKPVVLSDFSEEVENSLDYIYQPLFKKDYFTGYAYEPRVDASVDIRRGNAASYERHIRLGEFKTVEDMEASGFFSFS